MISLRDFVSTKKIVPSLTLYILYWYNCIFIHSKFSNEFSCKIIFKYFYKLFYEIINDNKRNDNVNWNHLFLLNK